MGKATRAKQEKIMAEEARIMSSFGIHNKKVLYSSKTPTQPLYMKLMAYKDYFLNSPQDYTPKTKSKNEDKQLLLMVRNTFAKYAVCQALTDVWNSYNSPNTTGIAANQPEYHRQLHAHAANQQNRNMPKATIQIDFKLWYICVAQGGSLYKEYAKEYLSKKEVHIFTTCPHELNVYQNLVYSVAKAAGKTNQADGIALRLARSNLKEKPFNDFWKTVIRFMAEHTPNTISEVNDLLDYIVHRKNEKATFSMAGQTLKVLTKGMIDWHYALRRVKAMGDHSWTGCYIPNEMFETANQDKRQDNIKWQFEQILNSKRLAQEGTQMRHCVYSYRKNCSDGNISIWSLSRSNGTGHMVPKVTIELDNYGSIRQARGLANRSMNSEERHVMELWCKKYDLSMTKYY